MKQYKFFRLCCILCGVIGVGTAQANVSGINILSETHHVWGSVESWEAEPLPGEEWGHYDVSDTVPVEGSVTGYIDEGIFNGFNWLYSESSAGNFSLHTEIMRFTPTAFAESTYVFSPLGTTLDMTIGTAIETTAYPVPLITITLYDLTDSVLLGSVDEGDFVNWERVNEYLFAATLNLSYLVNPEHQYEFNMYADGVGSDSVSHTWLTADLVSVIPAPGALLLGGIGVGCVSWLRRRRTL